jgi:glycosyltransferase involved in cell wall biosynthesis
VIRPVSVVLIAHPSPDLYGSDRQLLEAARALRTAGHDVVVMLPSSGPLRALLDAAGVRTEVLAFHVLRRAVLSPGRLLGMLARVPVALWRLVRLIRSVGPDVMYVNTVTLPWWVMAGRLARVPVVVHVHEAEEDWPRLVRWLLTAPLLFATAVVTNSQASRRALLASVSSLATRCVVIYNGIAGPESVSPVARVPGGAVRVALVARLSPRKGVDVALEAVAAVRAQGRSVELDVGGTAYAGYEWFEQQLRERAAQPDLRGAVRFLGYVNPTWPVLAAASVVLVPSRVEPFGNTAVEGLLAGRPVVASAVQGLTEIVSDGRTGILVPPGDVAALAAAIVRLLDDATFAAELADRGRDEAVTRFSVDRYRADMNDCLRGAIT